MGLGSTLSGRKKGGRVAGVGRVSGGNHDVEGRVFSGSELNITEQRTQTCRRRGVDQRSEGGGRRVYRVDQGGGLDSRIPQIGPGRVSCPSFRVKESVPRGTSL